MGLADLLGLQAPQPQQPMIPQMADPMAGINQARADNNAMAQAKPKGFMGGGFKPGSPIRDLLGTIGDVLLVANGGQPIYQARLKQRQDEAKRARMGSALAQYLGSGDAGLAAIFQDDPEIGIEIYKATRKKDDTPAAFDEFQHYQKLPPEQRPAYEKFLRLKHPGMMAPITVPDGASVEFPGQGDEPAGPEPTVNSQADYDALPPGTPYRDSQGNRAVKGGQTAPPSGGFPVKASGLTIERNNNPGALRVPGKMQFQRFATPQDGIRAQEAQLSRYHQRGLRNVASVIETYAPRKRRGGDNTDEQVNNYIAYVAKRIGVNPQDALSPAILPRLAAAMREFETGRRVD